MFYTVQIQEVVTHLSPQPHNDHNPFVKTKNPSLVCAIYDFYTVHSEHRPTAKHIVYINMGEYSHIMKSPKRKGVTTNVQGLQLIGDTIKVDLKVNMPKVSRGLNLLLVISLNIT